MIIICQYQVITYTTLVEDVESGRSYACVGTGCIWKIYVPSPQFCCEHKTALKNSIFFKVVVLDGWRARQHSEGVASKKQSREEDENDS